MLQRCWMASRAWTHAWGGGSKHHSTVRAPGSLTTVCLTVWHRIIAGLLRDVDVVILMYASSLSSALESCDPTALGTQVWGKVHAGGPSMDWAEVDPLDLHCSSRGPAVETNAFRFRSHILVQKGVKL